MILLAFAVMSRTGSVGGVAIRIEEFRARRTFFFFITAPLVPCVSFQFNLRCSGRDLAKPSAGEGREVLSLIPRSLHAGRLYQWIRAASRPSGVPSVGASDQSTC